MDTEVGAATLVLLGVDLFNARRVVHLACKKRQDDETTRWLVLDDDGWWKLCSQYPHYTKGDVKDYERGRGVWRRPNPSHDRLLCKQNEAPFKGNDTTIIDTHLWTTKETT